MLSGLGMGLNVRGGGGGMSMIKTHQILKTEFSKNCILKMQHFP